MEVEFFDTAEAVAEALTEAMKAADARVVWWRAGVKPGDCFMTDSGEGLERYRKRHLQHYRFCRCYSVACPEGELGDVHVSTIRCRVSRGRFQRVQRKARSSVSSRCRVTLRGLHATFQPIP